MILKMMSWNVNGLRKRIQSGFEDSCLHLNPDIICLQETRLLVNELPNILPGFRCYLNPAQQRGYSGTALFTKRKPIRVAFGFPTLGNNEGRIIVAEYSKFVLINVYTPNAKADLSRLVERSLWDNEFARVCHSVTNIKPVIICGDFNVAHRSIDVHSSSNKTKSAGFTFKEREAFDNLMKRRFVDSFRYINGETVGSYSYWSNYNNCRHYNIGWRLDYFLVDAKFAPHIRNATIEQSVGSSDHCPVTLSIWVPC